MKVDEVSKVPELPQIRSGEVQRQSQLEQQNVQPPKPPDQVTISQAARFTQEADQAARTEKLRQTLQHGVDVKPAELAKTLLSEGVVR